MILLGWVGCGVAGVEGWFVDLHGRVVDARSAAIGDAQVVLATVDGDELVRAATASDGTWHVPVAGTELTGNTLVAYFSAAGAADLTATLEVNLRSPEPVILQAGPGQTWQTTDRRIPTLRLADAADRASVDAQILDAVTGQPVPGLDLVVQPGWNAPIGAASVIDAVTDTEGRVRLEAGVAGWYTVLVAPTEVYDRSRFPVFLTAAGGQAMGTVSPHVGAGQLRAALVWAGTPFDLDLHLSAPLKGGQAGEDGNGQYHVYPGEPHHPELDYEGVGYEAAVERTSSAGWGPETIAIYDAPGPGEVRLSVVDMDNLADASSTALSESDAVLQVWNGEELARYYTVSPDEVATWWRPMVIDVDTAVAFQVEEYAVNVNPADADAF